MLGSCERIKPLSLTGDCLGMNIVVVPEIPTRSGHVSIVDSVIAPAKVYVSVKTTVKENGVQVVKRFDYHVWVPVLNAHGSLDTGDGDMLCWCWHSLNIVVISDLEGCLHTRDESAVMQSSKVCQAI